jgi:DNA-binding GntR family transcriptional regulator
MKDQKLSKQAYTGIKQLIQERRYMPGDRLSENDLSKILHMSRTPIREALHRLEDEQIVSIKPHLGAFVAMIDFTQLCEIYETREAIDGMIANILCKPHINTAPFSQLKEELTLIMRGPNVPEREQDMHRFGRHYSSTLRSLCGNRMLEKISESLTARIDTMGQITHVIPLFPEVSAAERLKVLDAVIKKDAVKAENAARQHVRNAFSRIISAAMPNST